jgi:hypothetical protein
MYLIFVAKENCKLLTLSSTASTLIYISFFLFLHPSVSMFHHFSVFVYLSLHLLNCQFSSINLSVSSFICPAAFLSPSLCISVPLYPSLFLSLSPPPHVYPLCFKPRHCCNWLGESKYISSNSSHYFRYFITTWQPLAVPLSETTGSTIIDLAVWLYCIKVLFIECFIGATSQW